MADLHRRGTGLAAAVEPDGQLLAAAPRLGDRTRCRDGALSLSVDQVADPARPPDECRRLAAAFTRDLDRIFARRTSGNRRTNPRMDALVRRYDDTLHQELAPRLAEDGVRILSWRELDGAERSRTYLRFHRWAFPLLTPMAVDSTHPMPRLRSLALNLIVRTADRVVYLPIPASLPRLVPVGCDRYVTVQSAAAAMLPELLMGAQILECGAFRITRSVRTGDVVRLEVERKVGERVLETLRATLAIAESGVYRLRSELAMGDAFAGIP